MFKTSTCRVAATLAGICLCLCGPAWALGSTPVTVVNPADIAKAEGIQHPYQNDVICDFSSGAQACSASFTSPTNQRLVLEYISGNCGLASGLQLTQIGITTQLGEQFHTEQHLLAVPAGVTSFGAQEFTFGQTVRLYADQNSTIEASAVANNLNSNVSFCRIVFSGQAIDVP